MNLMMLLDMATQVAGGREAFRAGEEAVTYQDLFDRAGGGASRLQATDAGTVAFVGQATTAFPSVVFAASWAGVPVVFMGAVLGLQVFNRNAWYKTLYNSSQLTWASAAAAWVYVLMGGPILSTLLQESSGVESAAKILTGSSFMLPFLVSGIAYFVINQALQL